MAEASNSRWGAGYALWLTAGLLLSAALLLAAYWEADRQEQLRVEAFHGHLRDLAAISTIIIAERLHQYDESLLVLRHAYAADPQGIAQALALLRRGPLADPALMVVVVDRDGTLAFTDAPRVLPHLFLGDRPYFRYFAAGGPDRLYVDEPAFGRVTKRHTLPLARPVYDSRGEFLGVVAISVTQASLSDLSPHFQLAADTLLTVVNRGGAIITRSHALAREQGGQLPAELLAPMLKARSGLLASRKGGAGGDQTMVSFRQLEGVPLIVTITSSPAAMLSGMARQRAILVAGAAFTALVIMVLLLVNLERQRMTARFLAAQRENLVADSNARLRAVAQAIPNMIWLKDPDGAYLNCNTMVERFFGVKEMDIVGRSDYAFVDRELADTFRQHDLQAMAAGKPCSHEQWVTFVGDGHRSLLEVVNAPLFDAAGATVGVLGIATDITAQRALQEALSQQLVALTQPLAEAADIRFADLFNIQEIQRIQDTFAQATGVASIITTPDGQPITRPSNFCRLCSQVIRATDRGLANCLRSDAELGRYNPVGPVIQPCLSGGLWDAGASLSVGGRHIANWLIGQVRNDELDETAMLDYADEIGVDHALFLEALAEVPVMPKEQFEKVAMALYSLANELSVKAYQNLQQARFIAEHNELERQLRATNDELERFTYTVSHDLKSPLITIQAFAGQVKKDLRADRREHMASDLDRIIKATTTLGLLLDDLLGLSRIGRMMLPAVPVAMGEVLQEVLAQLTGMINEHRIEVRVLADLPEQKGDRRQIAMVWQNLLENAIKYMGEQAAPRIEVGVREEGGHLVFFVRDNGMGIAPECQEEIFGLFRKLDPNSEGTGIGLALVKRGIEVQGGRVWVESAGVGQGSSFCFTLAA